MTFIHAGPSPVSLGVVAILSFGGLVVAAFASGYHLASHAGTPAVATAERATTPVDEEGTAVAAAEFAPIPGRIAEPLVDRDRAVLLAAPEDGEVVDELPSGRNVTISRESGDWLFVRYERDGKEREGWAHRINVERDEP